MSWNILATVDEFRYLSVKCRQAATYSNAQDITSWCNAVATADLLPSFSIPLLQWMAREAANLQICLGRVDFCHQVWRGHRWINQPLRAGDQ
jgi:hypothetical protein